MAPPLPSAAPSPPSPSPPSEGDGTDLGRSFSTGMGPGVMVMGLNGAGPFTQIESPSWPNWSVECMNLIYVACRDEFE